jgi:cytochrome c oxidase subunit 3
MSHAKHGDHAHHFESAAHEFESCKQGMWVFMVTEVLMFGGLFVAYAMFRGMYPEMFIRAHHFLDTNMGAVNTCVLLLSSLTMALAVNAAQTGKRQLTTWYLVGTILLAGAFMVVKYFEYEVVNEFPKIPLFFSLYFMMTGLHATHVLIGIGLIGWLVMRNQRGDFSPQKYTAVELVGFYWHFVDLVWIYVFPLMYLIH